MSFEAKTAGAAEAKSAKAAAARAKSKPKLPRPRDRWVRPFLKQYRRALLAALLLGVATFVFASALMVTSGYLISGSSFVETVLLLHLPLIFVRIFGIGKPILQYCERLASHDWVLRMTSAMRVKLFRVLERDAVFFRRTHRTGDILGLLAEDIGHIQNLYLRTVFPTVVAWVVLAIVCVVLGCFSAPLACAMLVSLGSTAFLLPLVSVLVSGAREARRKALRNELYTELTDNVLGVADWVFARRGAEYLSRYKAKQQAVRAEEAAMERFARRRDFAAQVLFGLGAVALICWAGGAFGGEPGWEAMWIAAFVLGFFPLIDAFAPLSTAAVEARSHKDSIERLNALPEDPADVLEGACATEGGAVAASAAPEPASPLDIRVEGVTYRYPGSARDVLERLSLTVPAGQKLAVLGRSGAGKSTLASLIRGDLVPCEGCVTLGGVDVRELGDGIARSVGVIQQQTYLFNMTLAENLRIGNPEATDEELAAVLAQVGLGPLLERLPKGLETMVDEAGLRFSGGERHRIALARVLLQDVPIVILDEPCAGLDPLTEKALLETVFTALEGRTVIMITHHLQGVALMDRVVFLGGGAVELDGAPEALERESERYRRLLAFDRGLRA